MVLLRTLRQKLPTKGKTETPGTDILIAKGPAGALVFAISLSRTAKWQCYSFQMLNTQSKIVHQ